MLAQYLVLALAIALARSDVIHFRYSIGSVPETISSVANSTADTVYFYFIDGWHDHILRFDSEMVDLGDGELNFHNQIAGATGQYEAFARLTKDHHSFTDLTANSDHALVEFRVGKQTLGSGFRLTVGNVPVTPESNTASPVYPTTPYYPPYPPQTSCLTNGLPLMCNQGKLELYPRNWKDSDNGYGYAYLTVDRSFACQAILHKAYSWIQSKQKSQNVLQAATGVYVAAQCDRNGVEIQLAEGPSSGLEHDFFVFHIAPSLKCAVLLVDFVEYITSL